MTLQAGRPGLEIAGALHISSDWRGEDLSLYLGRCQIDTPLDLVDATWQEVRRRRKRIGAVVDFGAGDGRFARHGGYSSYVGYEIDLSRCSPEALPENARIAHRCAFSEIVQNADLAIGNPPFVRNQDLPSGWRQKVTEQLQARSGVVLSGLANAWQYFFLLSLLSIAEDGLCALVIPYEWVSRPSAAHLRGFIRTNGWDVDVYRIADATFGGVLTTSSITIVDKRRRTGRWRFYADDGSGDFTQLLSESGAADGHLPYVSARSAAATIPRAVRGLSPGSQQVFTLTEAQRARFGLMAGEDVFRCVTSLRHLPADFNSLDEAEFDRHFRHAGQKCWLLNVQGDPSDRLKAYLQSVDETKYATATCLERDIWWQFKMPPIPELLVATSFKGLVPKICVNEVGARAVGGIAGIHGLTRESGQAFMEHLSGLDIRDRIVAHANGLRKIEINQLNALLAQSG